MSGDGPDLGERIVGYMMVVGGVLIALLSGACSASVLGASEPGSRSTVSLAAVAIFGGLPFLGGVGLVVGGAALLRRRRRPDQDVF